MQRSTGHPPRFRHVFEKLGRIKRWVAPSARPSQQAEGALGERPPSLATPAAAPSREITARERRALVALSWPIAVGMLGETAVGLVDTKLVGALGPEALAGVGVATVLMYLGYAVTFGLLRGVKVRTAHAVGAGKPEDGVAYAKAGALLAFGLGLAIFALGRDVSWALRLLGVDPRIAPHSLAFFEAVSWGAPGACVASALLQYRQGKGDAKTPMTLGLVGNVANAALALALIHGLGPIPAMGVRGCGLATAIVQTGLAFVWLGLLARERRPPRLALGQASREVLSLGAPTALQFGLEMLAFTAFTGLISGFGASAMAAHQVALMVLRASFLPGIAVGEAASILVGQALGARDLARADRVVRSAVTLAVGFMAACGLVFAAAGAPIARAFASDPEVVTLAAKLLLLAALFQVLDASNIVLRGSLRGAKDVRVPALFGIVIIWVAVPGAAFLLGKQLGLGVLGAWGGFLVETALGTLVLGLRWAKGGWRRAYEGERVGAREGLGAPTPAAAAA
jgi:MATE family multidrug resistance protein